MDRIGIIGGTNADFAFQWSEDRAIETRWGTAEVSVGATGDAEVLFVRRHGRRHERLSSSVDHRANIGALKEAGARAIIATTVCGIVDATVPLAQTIVFDDLFFPDNRLPGGEPCTFFDTPGEAGRGHYIFGSPFSAGLRAAMLAAAHDAGSAVRDGGTYAYMLGPRFNTATEIAWLNSLRVTGVSQTAGPEAVLAGELEVPYALLGFGVDYANGVMPEPTAVDELNANLAASRAAFSTVVAGAIARLSEPSFDTGFVYRFE